MRNTKPATKKPDAKTQEIVDRLQRARKAIPGFRKDVRDRIANSLEYTLRGMPPAESVVSQYESIAMLYGEDYEQRAAAEDAELAREIDG